jgi:DNA (cytosine-5)-methyltransferase 1
LKVICSFPNDYILTGTYAQQWERLGRSVPPFLMKAIAENVYNTILK